MKKILSLIICFFSLANFSKAQYVMIPDDQFRQYLQYKYPSCFNESGQMDTTCAAILNETTLNLRTVMGISDLTGLQYFKSLTYLDCSQMIIPSLPNLPGSLIYLDCSNDYLSNLPPLPNSLTYLNCLNNSFTILPPLPTSLTYLSCGSVMLNTLPSSFPASLMHLDFSGSNNITEIPGLPPSLVYFNCSAVSTGELPSLPNTLDTFDCSYNNLLINLPTLPNRLRVLGCGYCNQLTGITGLPDSLITLGCSNDSSLTSISALPGSLKYLYSSNCKRLKTLPNLPDSLIYLDCSTTVIYMDTTMGSFTNIPTLPKSLKYLACSGIFSSLPTLPDSLTTFICSRSPLIKNLPALPNSLTNLNVAYDEDLTALPNLPESLLYLSCTNTGISSLPALPGSLPRLTCEQNTKLTSLPALPNSLKFLDCNNNALTTLPASLNSLDTIFCIGNQLTSLPNLPDSLVELACAENNIYCLPKLPSTLTYLYIDEKIHCLPNRIDGISSALPLCNPTNNVEHCQEFPVMNGNIFYDNNSNGVKDPTELYMPYVQLKLSDGDYTYSNSKGYYEIGADDNLGTYALAVYAPKYYKAVPVIMTYNFTSNDTLVTKDIAMQPTVFIDTLNIGCFSYTRFARPGNEFPVVVGYSNIGTTTLSPTITLNYDNALLTFDSSSNPSVINNGNSLSLSQSGFVPGQSGSFVAYFFVKTTDVLGDSVKLKTTATANAVSVSDSINTIVSSSFDPNEKDATPQLTPAQVAKGKPIVYTIRFQNTGNDTAFNIVIADTLSNLLVDSTLQMINSSKPCKVTVMGNVVYFEFLNVLLPDNKTNDLGSNGYVSFSVQPKSSLTGGSISNTASIYFDYNAPVVTNTATTIISDGTVPIRFVNFAALEKAGNSSILLYWNTADEVNTKSFIVQQSSDGIHFIDVTTIAATGFGNNSYSYYVNANASVTYYRLKMVDINGHFTYSTVVELKPAKNIPVITLLTNPARGKMIINASLPDNINARLMNGQGAVLKEFVLHNGIQSIDVSSLPAGLYYIKANQSSLKVIVSK